MNPRLDRLQTPSRHLGLAILIVVFSVQGVLTDLSNGTMWEPSPLRYLGAWTIQWLAWVLLAPLVFRIGELHPLGVPPRLRALGMHALASVGITGLAVLLGALVSSVFAPAGAGDQVWRLVNRHVAVGLPAYWALLAFQQLLLAQAGQARRALEAERIATELERSRLQLLRTQLQPHFLFNTLHAIVTLLDEDTPAAEDMLLRLSALLRAFLEQHEAQEIPLHRELELLELYLGIVRRRYGERLDTLVDAAPDVLDAAVPGLLLQPLVENAVQHGIGRNLGEDCIAVHCWRDGGQLRIEVRNRNSTLAADATHDGHGIGLSNTRMRLAGLYGAAAQLRLYPLVPGGVACSLRLPLRRTGQDASAPQQVPA